MDKVEFRRVYDQYHGLVSKIAYNVIEDYHLAQDITQDIFATLYAKWDCIDIPQVKGWLITCATRKAIDYKRKVHVDREVLGENELEKGPDGDSAEHEIIRKAVYWQVLNELYHKNPQWFELVMRLDVDGDDPRHVAGELGISLNNLRVRHHRAKVWLSERYKKT